MARFHFEQDDETKDDADAHQDTDQPVNIDSNSQINTSSDSKSAWDDRQNQPLSPPPSANTFTQPDTDFFCKHCGHNLTGIPIGAPCPKCGQYFIPPLSTRYSNHQSVSGMAITCFVLGIISIISNSACLCVGGVLLGLPTGLTAIVFFFLARSKIKTNLVHPSSKGFNVAGLVCAVLSLLITLAVACFIWTSAWKQSQTPQNPNNPNLISPAQPTSP